jgi:DNA-binding MarR family transcriptional regulator
MPRKARINAPGALHHVIIRGIERRKIFRSVDDRILGDSDFVENVLKKAKEALALEEKYELKAHGYDFDWAVSRVAESIGVTLDEVTAFAKSPRTVKAPALLCYWAHRKLGMTATEIARRLKIGQPAASRLSRRGEQIEKELGLHLID